MQRRDLLKGLCAAGLAQAAGASLAAAAQPTSAAPADPAVAPAALGEAPPRLDPKVLVVVYDPVIPSEGKPLSAIMRWNDPHVLADGYIADLKDISNGYVNYHIVDWQNATDIVSPKVDGFKYANADDYMACIRGKAPWHQPDRMDHAAFCRQFDLERRVAAGEIDEVWMFSSPFGMGGYESTMAGPNAYWCNSPPVEGVDSKRLFVIMGFSLERGVGEMLEDLGHRSESILAHVYGSWEPKPTHTWNRFTLHDKVAPGEAACGTVHYSPNSDGDYDWGNPRFVPSTCDDWLDYPNLTGKKRLVNKNDWDEGDCRGHHRWWFRRFPNAPGRAPDGKLNNWWPYVIDPNLFPESNNQAPKA